MGEASNVNWDEQVVEERQQVSPVPSSPSSVEEQAAEGVRKTEWKPGR